MGNFAPSTDAPTGAPAAEDERSGRPTDVSSASLGLAPLEPRHDRYARGGVLGAGAMGSVHDCDDRHLEREVALKVMKPELAANEALRARFAREARIQGKLEHPGIVPVHDLGIDEKGSPYFTMKKVRGRSFRALIDGAKSYGPSERRASRRRLLSAFATVCLTVAFAHSRGVVHRDIKPSNIMVGDFGEVYLLDWGIAKELRADPQAPDVTRSMSGLLAESAAAMTSAGDVLGTVGYMAPEQLRGEAVDERADVYALGAVLFEILTLEHLHQGSRANAMGSTILGVDARPSARAPGADESAELEELCVRATALDAAARPTAREMHAVVDRVLDGAKDVEKSRALSAEHVVRARAELKRSLAGALGAREKAIQETHRAIVLDGANAEALELLRVLAQHCPDDIESSASHKVDLFAGRAHRIIARTLAALFVPWIFSIAILFTGDVRNPPLLALTLAAVVATAVLIALRSRFDHGGLVYAALATGLVACALMGCLCGPFIIVPGLLACVGVIFGAAATRPDRAYVGAVAMAGALAAFVVPLALELCGWLPPSYAIQHAGILILPRAVTFEPGGATLYLVIFNASMIVIPGIVAQRVRAHDIRVERRAFETAARLRGLLPQAARVVGPTTYNGDEEA